jgi:RNA polymerase sigma factor (sigma-70 family)
LKDNVPALQIGAGRCYKDMVAVSLIGTGEDAFERLFAEEYTRVASVALRITRDAGEAEDVAQEVFVRFARSHRPPDGARAWLYKAAVHVALNAVRSRRRRAARELRDGRLRQSLDANAQAAADPHRILERQSEQAAVRAALLRLHPKDAEILALRYAGLPYREIAAVIGVDAAQIGTRLARAERAFKREIERETFG